MNDNPVFDQLLNSSSGLSPLGLTTARDAVDFAGRGQDVSSGLGLGIASIVISLLTTAARFGFEAWQTKKQNEYNKQLLDQQNEYNSPVSQMARLKEAGINPMLLASQGGVSAGSSELGKKEVPNYSGVINSQMMMNALSLMSQISVNNAQIRNLDASADLKASQALTEASKKKYYDSYANKADFWTTNLGPAQARFMNLKADYSATELKYADSWIATRIYLNMASAEQKEALVERYSHLNNLTDQQIKESLARIALFQEQGKYYAAMAAKGYREIDSIDMDIILKFWDTQIKQEVLKLQGEKADTWVPEKVADIVDKAMRAGKSAVEILQMLKLMGIIPI